MKYLVLVGALLGCRGDKAEPKGEPPACIAAAQQVAPRYLAGARRARPGTKVTELEVAGHINAACAMDGWTPAVIACFAGVASDAELAACDKKLAKDQAEKLDRAVLEAFAAEAGRGAPPGGDEPAGRGSAGSGSGSE